MLLPFSAFLQKAIVKGNDNEVVLALRISETPSSHYLIWISVSREYHKSFQSRTEWDNEKKNVDNFFFIAFMLLIHVVHKYLSTWIPGFVIFCHLGFSLFLKSFVILIFRNSIIQLKHRHCSCGWYIIEVSNNCIVELFIEAIQQILNR